MVLYPNIEPYQTGMLAVSDLHTIHYEVSGKKDGEPVLFLHGGPGGGTYVDTHLVLHCHIS
jgi:proline iminopeptidase